MIHSGWISPDRQIEEAAGTAMHDTLLGKFGESDRHAFFSRGAIRYVDSTDYLSLELVCCRVALENAVAVLMDRWADRPEVEVEFIAPPGLMSASASGVLQELRRRLCAIPRV
jgi:hypothetical protein